MNAKAPHDLLHERGEIIDQMKAMLDRASDDGRDLTKSEQARFDRMNQKAEELRKLAEKASTVGAMVQDLDKPFGQRAPRATIDSGLPSNGLELFYRRGIKTGINNGMTIGTDGEGGYSVVDQLAPDLFGTLEEVNPIFRDCGRATTSGDNYIRVFTVRGAASGRVAESGSRAETASPAYARQSVSMSMLYAIPQVSEELLAASEYDIEAHLREEIATSFNAELEAEFLTGNGVAPNQKGILTAADSTDADDTRPFTSYQLIPGSLTDGVTYDELVGLLHALPPRYRNGAKLYAGTEVIQAMRLLKDGANLPVWRDTDGGSGRPQTFLGVEVVETPQMPGFGASAKTLIYGNLARGYAFVSHSQGVMVHRDPYTTPGFVKFYTRLYCGSGPMDTRAIKVLRQAAA